MLASREGEAASLSLRAAQRVVLGSSTAMLGVENTLCLIDMCSIFLHKPCYARYPVSEDALEFHSRHLRRVISLVRQVEMVQRSLRCVNCRMKLVHAGHPVYSCIGMDKGIQLVAGLHPDASMRQVRRDATRG